MLVVISSRVSMREIWYAVHRVECSMMQWIFVKVYLHMVRMWRWN